MSKISKLEKFAQNKAAKNVIEPGKDLYNSIKGNWKKVKQNIAIKAVKRYLSNILTDTEKQKSFCLFLGEFDVG